LGIWGQPLTFLWGYTEDIMRIRENEVRLEWGKYLFLV